ncbi:hypothetical protein HPB48_000222 [Haemaphysalis longicornis]|uniref:Uncharacterized protein n=1 Tax=Haemaphysalis longicornis TaxID=44386 RepID=A0A9J6GBQ7_HAELO|nr:hypothetical protein HPB48_000222 [Haemaphysalis longicornis]
MGSFCVRTGPFPSLASPGATSPPSNTSHRGHLDSRGGRSLGWLGVPPPLGTPARPERGDQRPTSQSLSGGRLLSDRHPQEPPSIYTAEELRRLCPYCRVPQIHLPTHLAGALHRDCMTAAIAAASASAGPRTEDSVAAAFALLLHHRPDLLRDPLPADHVIDMPDES